MLHHKNLNILLVFCGNIVENLGPSTVMMFLESLKKKRKKRNMQMPPLL